MVEYFIGERVRILPGAAVSKTVLGRNGTVEGYDEVDGEDYVIVRPDGFGGRLDQWLLPREIAPAGDGGKHAIRYCEDDFEGE